MKKIVYYQNNHLVEEINPTWSTLLFLYQNITGKVLRRLLYRRWIALLLGKYYESSLSKRDIQPFIKKYTINMNDYQEPVSGYKNFNDFFIRAFKPGARAINNNQKMIIAPADSKVYVIQNITKNTHFFVKHNQFDLVKFLGSSKLADEYAHGTLFIFRLAPYDYHRFHFPTDCIPSAAKIISGILESVNPLVFKAGIQPLLENQRHMIMLKSECFDNIIMMPIGAMMVGKIVETYTPEKLVHKGDQTGYFAFGGSTVVLLFKAGIITPRTDFVQHSLQGIETAVKMGEAINE